MLKDPPERDNSLADLPPALLYHCHLMPTLVRNDVELIGVVYDSYFVIHGHMSGIGLR